MIIDYDFKQNTHSDIDFVRTVIDETIEEQDGDVPGETTEVSLDGAYFDQALVNKASDHNINLSFTNLVGRKPSSDFLSIVEFEVDLEEDVIHRCPAGILPVKSRLSKNEQYAAHFNKKDCEACPLREQCPMKPQKKYNVVRFSKSAYQTAGIRKEMDTEDHKAKASKRAAIEGIPSILRRKYRVDHMPVMGYLRSKLAFGFKILAKNARSLQMGLKYMG